MHDIQSSQILESSHDVFQKAKSLSLGKSFLLLEVAPEISFFAKFGDNVHVVASLVDVEESDDVFVL